MSQPTDRPESQKALVWCNCIGKCKGGKWVHPSTRGQHAKNERSPPTSFANFVSGTPHPADIIAAPAGPSNKALGKRRVTGNDQINLAEGPSKRLRDDRQPASDLEDLYMTPTSPEPALQSTFRSPSPPPEPGSLEALEREEQTANGPLPAASRNLEPEVEHTAETHPSRIEDIRITQEFIASLQTASLNSDNLDPDVLYHLRNPPSEPLNLDDPDLRLSLDVFLAVSNASQETYHSIRAAIQRYNPNSGILSYDQIKRHVSELSGVSLIVEHMCVNTCIAYTGPFKDLETCPQCSEPRYDPLKPHAKVPRQQFHTIPLGPQLQALWRTSEGAAAMQYRAQCTDRILNELEQGNNRISVYEDWVHGHDYLTAVQDNLIGSDDITLLFSIDGAQLYQNKTSDCWIYIWVVLDLAPDLRYKKKTHSSWRIHTGTQKAQKSRLFLVPGVSSSRSTSTRRHKTGSSQYYPACLKPDDYQVEGCDHDDYLPRSRPYPSSYDVETRYQSNLAYVIASPNQTQYKARRLTTGICKPTIFSGLPRTLGIPRMFPTDLMHLMSLNLTDILLGLWRGMVDCDSHDNRQTWDWAVLQGSTWRRHGKSVADATPYLPDSFDHPPRNPAEKISSGYKAWEFLLYIFGLAPALLHGILPEIYWKNFCKLVYAVRILHQRSISRTQVVDAQKTLLDFGEKFEQIYYRCKESRIHFCRQSIHQMSQHIAREVI
ncbi:hypothetical protein EW146_g9401 [Bondarzewia mesenterica]|uniref:Uncharacterized protein n=1 Tax=Bondarzewia mesenterica TaxID=1095465 RepID=A0A4S4L6X4_9AGAM|nr:hypothetical protein EW146_g9401 [Bondarzewia mesenterica]